MPAENEHSKPVALMFTDLVGYSALTQRNVSGAFLATVQVGLRATDQALASLAQAEAQHSYLVGLWKVDPDLDSLRSDPRFTEWSNDLSRLRLCEPGSDRETMNGREWRTSEKDVA